MDPLRVLSLTSALAMLGVEGVAQDREQPCAQVAAALKVVDVGSGANEGILHQIIDPGGIIGQGEGERP